jgi:hypothetical protein
MHVVNITGTGSDLFSGFSTYNFCPPLNGNCSIIYASTSGTQNVVGGTYQNLTVSGGGSKALAGSPTVKGSLTLTNGVLSLGSNSLTIGDTGYVSGTPSTTAMVVATGSGELRKSFSSAGSFTFPVGDNTGTVEYSPATVTINSADAFSSAYVSAKLSNAAHSNNVSAVDYLSRYWTLGASGITNPNYTATFQYVNADVVGSTESNIYCGRFGGSWSLFSQTNDATNTLTASNITTLGDFTGGENGALPVELSTLMATAKDKSINISWSTATETNNAGFEIERALPITGGGMGGGLWQRIGFVQGNGTTNAPQSYSFVDASAKGKVSYRLKQIDRDGSFKYSQTVEATAALTAADFSLSQNYPNPFNPNTMISFAVQNAEHVTVTVYNALGQSVATLFEGIANPNELYTLNFDGKLLSSGTYFYSLRSASRNEVKKMVLTK